jgi:polysaccharide chain length determinant protein (PEP-CTERM system associated)
MAHLAVTGPGLSRPLEVWRRRKWLAVLAFVGTFTAAVSAVRALPPMYQSTATVLVEHQVPESLLKPGMPSELDARLHTITHEVLSRARLSDLVARFHLYPELRRQAPAEVTIEQMRRDILLDRKAVEQAWGRTATIAFTLSYRGRDPDTVAAVTNELAAFYVAENTKIRERQATGTTELLEGQLAEVKRKFGDQERRVSEFKMRHIGELPQQVEANLQILGRLNTQLYLNGEKQLRALERREMLVKQLAGSDSLGAASDPAAAAARLAKLNQELQELRSRFSDKYPDVLRVKGEIEALERQLALEPATPPAAPEAGPVLRGFSTALRAVEAELQALKAEEKRLRASITTYERRVENTPRRQQELLEVTRDYEATKEVYQSLLKRLEEARLAESVEQGQRGEMFRILDIAMPAALPYTPNRVRLLIMSVLVAGAIAVGAAVLAEQLDTSFHSVESLRAFTRVPVLISIPEIDTTEDRVRRRWRFVLTALSAAAGLVLVAGASHYVAHGNEELVRLLSRGKL